MAKELPMACTLSPEQLERRLEKIAAIGADGLLAAELVGERHVLRFRADAELRSRLEEIVAAEAECCSFLDLAIDEAGGELILSIDAPARGRAFADGIAATFG